MLVREYTDADLDAFKRVHEKSGFDYNLPPLSSEEFYSRRVIGDDANIGMGLFLKLTSEAYLICNPKWRNPAWRWDAFKQIHRVSLQDAKSAGVKEIEAFLPPQVGDKFGKRLVSIGWQQAREDWKSFSYEVR